MYRVLPSDEPISQGDIVDDCPIFGLDAAVENLHVDSDPVRWIARVVVMTQACDLATGRTTRAIVAVVHEAQELVDAGILKAPAIRDRIRRHQVFGWYFLPQNDQAGLPESLVDLRNLHTVPLAILNQLAGSGKRQCRIETPYREHLSQHFANTYARIGLPEPYETRS
jgi:hypothetical protein